MFMYIYNRTSLYVNCLTTALLDKKLAALEKVTTVEVVEVTVVQHVTSTT
jgi:hypothetical protein